MSGDDAGTRAAACFFVMWLEPPHFFEQKFAIDSRCLGTVKASPQVWHVLVNRGPLGVLGRQA
jgi:hypothetical protein